MTGSDPFATYLELRESLPDGALGAGLSHSARGLVLFHVLELAAHGEPRGAVTFVHDAGDHGGRYLHVAERLARDGWAIALPDLRGHGRSEGARGHSNGIQEVLRDLGDVQDHLAYRQPGAPQVLVGQGLGALQCLAYAAERPEGVAALVLCAPLLAPPFVLPSPASGVLKLFKKVSPTSPGRIAWEPDERVSDPGARTALREDPLVHDVVTLRAGEEARAAAAQFDARLRVVRAPTLLLVGGSDRFTDTARFAGLARGGLSIQTFRDGSHDLFHDVCRAEALETLARWLDRALPR